MLHVWKGKRTSFKNIFSHPSLVIYFFPTSPIKLKLGLQIRGRLLIPTHVDQSNYLTNQQQVLGFAVPRTSLSKLCQNARPKLTCFDFSSSKSNLQVHILSTGGVALSNSCTMLLAQPAQNYAAPFSQVRHICRTRGFAHDGIMVVAQNCISV